ncbi:protein phosphatase 1 regulatory subunit 12A isoform X2 [Anopheles merus]|uniref:protein phosphatase 1 regulatory subunit 12A isoform X2 n=1 Tax=Anopheles merus TaxID=30066 RepID=UPI001BE3E498|nr:protein phosphatase 1 regulatory subunit 12A isoform X2 [Anopheles merus]
MSLDNRNTSAQYKRAEQLKRWEESEMNKKLSGVPKSPSSRRIKFSSGCIFLAACVAGDKEEVEWLLKNGADIDTANVDGLTALHQACIDDNLDMVEFLVQKGADVNRKDNEGWTPLHATASCGFLSIARYLIENGADLASINSDGELAVDLANSDAMEDLIQHHLDEQGIDCEEARQAEERIMLSDATKWLRTDSPDCDKAHPKTGATAIHVAAAKGYIGVLKLLLEGRGDIDRQDVDGWTPLHAAAYWGQKEATQMLLNASADIDVQNYSGQLAIDIAQDDIVPLLKDARKNGKRTKRRPPSHGNRITDNFENSTETPTKVIRVEVKPIDSNKEKEAGGSVAVDYGDDDVDDGGENVAEALPESPPVAGDQEEEEEADEKDEEEDEETMDDTVDEALEEEEEVEEEEVEEEEEEEEEAGEEEEEQQEHVSAQENRPGEDVTDSSIGSVPCQQVLPLPAQINQTKDAESDEEEEEEEEENGSVSSEPYSSSNPSADSSMTESETDELLPRPVPIISRPTPVPLTTQIVAPKPRVTEPPVPSNNAAPAVANNPAAPPTAPWRRARAVPTPVPRQFYEEAQQPPADDVVDYANLVFTSKRNLSEKENKPTEPDVILRRTQSFESDEKFYQRYAELRARIQANSCPHTILPSTPINTKTSTASNNNNNSSNNNNNNNNNSTTNNSSGTTTTPASNISSYLVQRSASLKDHRTLRKTTSNLVLGSTTTSPSSATGPASGATTNLVPPAATGTGAANNTTGSTTGSSGAVSPPTSPSGTPTTTPTAGQIRSSIPTPITLNSHKNTTMSNNTDNSSSTTTTTTPFGDRYRKRYEDQPETVRKPSATNSTVANDHTSSTTTTSAPEAADHTAHETTLTPATGPETNKNHSLFELNRKYIEQAQKTKINNERNKFLSSLNEKRQQQLQEQQQQEQQQQRRQQPAEQPRGGGRYDGRPGKPEASQEEASFEEPAAVKLIMPSYTAAPVPAAVLEQQPPAGTTPVTTSPSSNKLSPGNIFKNFFKSFVPPTRDEESETQRKAHAKRVRETRRSTQGVTLDEIKSAEQLVKKKNATGSGNENDTMAPATATATTTTTTPSSPSSLSSTASPSFTNDRVPAVGSTGDQQQQQGSNHVTEGSAAQDAAGGGVGGGSTKVEEIAVSASFTLAAPGSSLDDGGDGGGGGGGGGGHRRHRRSVAGMDEEEDDSKVTVSYTISAPVRQSSPSPRAVAAAAAAVSNSKESADPLDGTGAGDVPAVTATFHVPATASEPMVATSATIRTSSGAAGGVVSNSDSNTTTTNTSNSNNNNTSASFNTNHNTAATTTTYTKRSLFDIDNANSLTLAEKLRHEANKYAIAAVADGDLDSHLVARVPGSNSGTTNSGGGDESNSTSTNAPADNSAASAGAAVPPSPTLRKADPATTTTTGVTAERRPSWRLKVDGGSKFKLEDASTPNAATQSSSVASSGSVYEPSGPANQAPEHGLTTTKLTSSSALAQRRAQQQNGDSSTATTGTTSSNVASSRPLSAPASGLAAGEQYNRVPGSAATAAGEQQTVAAATDPNSPLHHLRRPPKSAGEENKENDKENDSRSTAQATQAVIQRRRRQKRRSTGVVSVGMEDLDPDRQDSPVDGDEKETGSERGRSRVGSTASELDTANQPQDSTRENGGDCIDYKALYEQEKADNDKLKMALRKKDEEVVTLKAALDRFTTATTKNNSLSELEKRERRAMERKMSEMEEELKLLQKYKTENERLRAENRALTRVVSKLTTSAQNQIHASKQ